MQWDNSSDGIFRFHEDDEMSTEKSKKSLWDNPNRRVRKETMTAGDLENRAPEALKHQQQHGV